MKFQPRETAWRQYLSRAALALLSFVFLVLSSLSTSAHAKKGNELN